MFVVMWPLAEHALVSTFQNFVFEHDATHSSHIFCDYHLREVAGRRLLLN
jgi:hypothetical protein